MGRSTARVRIVIGIGVAILAMIGLLAARPAAAPAGAAAPLAPNLLVLQGEGVQVTYSTNGLDGRARLTYADRERTRTFTGDQIRVTATGVGTLVTVPLTTPPDASITFTVIIPRIVIALGQTVPVDTQGFTMLARPPDAGSGQAQTYRCIELSGTARLVVS
jgi:hypothetical protein